jgi:LEA14-like dessication related protein
VTSEIWMHVSVSNQFNCWIFARLQDKLSVDQESDMKSTTLKMFPTLQSKRTIVAFVVACFLLQSCVSLDPNYEEPTVILSSIRAIPSDDMVPSFEVGLRIINPNTTPLDLEGVVYSISLQGHELVKGVGKGYQQIEGYSEGNITLTASANLLSGIRFIADLMQQQNEPFDFEFKAKLDLAGFYPSLNISETGTLDFNNRE